MKKFYLLVVLMAVCGATLFAQEADAQKKKSLFSAGLYGDFMGLSASAKYDGEKVYKESIIGGGFGVFFDATYAELGLGLDFTNSKDKDNADDKGFASNYFSISLLGKYPIALGKKFTLSPLLGFDWNIFTSGKYKDDDEKVKRADLPDDYKDSYDAFLINLGVGADYAFTDALYLRGSFLYGFKMKSKDERETVADDSKYKIFTGGITVNIAIGYRF